MKLWKKIGLGLVGLLLVAIAFNWKLLVYGYYQLKGQLEVIRNVRSVEEVLNDPLFPDSLKTKLKLVQTVRAYAVTELGLINNDNYTTVYDQKGKDILWNLSASEPFKLEAYEWYFPFLGHMPYKGFFSLDDAKREREELIKKGYDTRIRTVGGWSTLGILKDPILSRMLERSEGQLAEVIIHELTHSTLFVEDEVTFNENLASFIGEQGAALFLADHYGDSSEEIRRYQRELWEEKKFTRLILSGAKKLDSLYSTFTDSTDPDFKFNAKKELIYRITQSVDTIDFIDPRYTHIFDQAQPNNAYFMSFMTYHSQEDTLNSIYEKYDRNIKRMIEGFKAQYGK